MDPLCYIALVMFASGAVGGLVNYFISEDKDEKPLTWWQHLIVGIAAAFVVPLLLNMTSGNLLDKIRGAGGASPDYSQLFVLAGFCLIAATSSRAFIRSLSRRVLEQAEAANKKATAALKEASEAKTAVKPLMESDPEPLESGATADTRAAAAESTASSIGEEEMKVLRALMPGTKGYTMRTIAGISAELSVDKQRVRDVLEALEGKAMVSRTKQQETNKTLWSLTSPGRRAADG